MFDLQKSQKQEQICNIVFDILKGYDDDFIEYDFDKERLAKSDIKTLIKDKIDFKSQYDFDLHYNFANYSFRYCYDVKEEFEKVTGLNYSDISECRIYFNLKNPLDENKIKNFDKTIKANDKNYLYCFKVFDLELNEIESIIRYVLDVSYKDNKKNDI